MASLTSAGDRKTELRRRIIARRKRLDADTRHRLDGRIHEGLLAFLEQRAPVRIAAYWAVNGEPDLAPALEALHRAGCPVHLPVLEGDGMTFRRWVPGAPMSRGRMGIPEPARGEICAPQDLELVLMPLVAYAADGTRLGMGAGYYDRSFGFRLDQAGSGPVLVGVAYSLQEVDDLPADRWDVPLDGVVTENGVRWFA